MNYRIKEETKTSTQHIRAISITDGDILDELKAQEYEKAQKVAMKEARKIERDKKRLEKENKKKEKERQQEQKRLVREQKRLEREVRKREKERRQQDRRQDVNEQQKMGEVFQKLTISDHDSVSDDYAVCPKCGALYGEDSEPWICCDGCNCWFDLKCSTIESEELAKCIEVYFCENCQQRM